MNKNIIIDLKYLKDIIKRFEERPNLIEEKNSFANGLNLIIMKGGLKE